MREIELAHRNGSGRAEGAQNSSAQATPITRAQACEIPVSSHAEMDIRLLREGDVFRPPFCPNTQCRCHQLASGDYRRYMRWGYHWNACFGAIQRYRCRECGRSFSEMSFSIDYYCKRKVDCRHVENSICEGSGVRATARSLAVSTGTVANRVQRLARGAFVSLLWLNLRLDQSESLAFDGFRSFCTSQHAPCDLTHLIGRESDYVYSFDFAPLRRGGRMREAQKRSRAHFERLMRADPRASEHSARRVYDTIIRMGRWPADTQRAREIWSDEHHAYRDAWNNHEAMQQMQYRGWVRRRTVSSLASRTKANPLRAVNYFDREIRKDLADHRRESVCFARCPYDMLARFAVYVVHHNMDKPRRVRGSRSPKPAERVARSHAVAAGARPRTVAELQLWRGCYRAFASRVCLSEFARTWWFGLIPAQPDRRYPHVPQYALG